MNPPGGLPPCDIWGTFMVAAEVWAASAASAAALSALQTRRLAALLAAAKAAPLYRELIGERPDRIRLQDLPVAHKPELMRQFDRWVADPCLKLDELQRFTADVSRVADPYAGRYVVWESSGSSGEPGLFVQDMRAMAVYDALEALRRPLLQPMRSMFDSWGSGERMAFVGATGGHFASMVSVQRLKRLNPGLSGRLHCVSFLQPTPSLVAELDSLMPSIVATYPSVAVVLAEERRAGRSALAPREIWTGGENLAPTMRAFIRDTFNCPVIDSYGTSEFLSLACECRHGSLHLNSDWVILESVDASGKEVPSGQFGSTTLLTNLANHVQPLIRYDIGDRIRLHAGGCACGSHLPVITVQGRDDDTLQLGDGGGRAVSVPPLALCTVLEDEAQLFDFQIVQDGPCALSLRTGLQGRDASTCLHRARTMLAAYLTQIGAIGVRIHCLPDKALLRGRTGKVRRVLATPARA